MGLLADLLLLPITAPARGLYFVLNTIAEQVDQEFTSADKVREKLMELQLRCEMGEVSEEEYAASEAFLLERLNVIQQAQEESE
jgi:hypothetical protein